MSNLSGVSDSAEKTTPLYEEHVKCGAKLIPFGGWLMPVQYSGIVDEHQAVRKNAGVFDISHMGQFVVTGADAGRWLNRMLTNNTEKLEVGQGQYTFLLNENGGIIDDLIAYRTAPDEFLLVVNAARSDEDLAWLEKHRPSDVALKNRSADFGAVAVQGPKVVEIVKAVFGVDPPPRNQIVQIAKDGKEASMARTGYTGEDGVEIFFPAEDAVWLWNKIVSAGAKPCGLGARDTLRLEMCYPLNGSDLSPEHNPIEAGLGFFVDLQKGEFIGREKLAHDREQGPARKLVPFRMTGKGPPPRPHYGVYQNGERVAEVTSGTLSPSLNYGIGMAYLPAGRAKIGAPLEIEIRERKFPAIIEKKPFYKKS
jgi:glycine cleavage system T protein (aminomethyltransferase)